MIQFLTMNPRATTLFWTAILLIAILLWRDHRYATRRRRG